jgi:chemotaxis protein MotB
LEYDPDTGSCKFDSDVLFDSGDARLKPDAQRLLKEFAELFRTADARDLRVMVVGHTDNRTVARRETRERFPDNWHLSTARALAVADFLQQAGVREDQVGVSGYGRHQPVSPNSTADDRQRNRRVEIFVLSPETPIVGWTESTTNLY